jgi:ankyrin repeat protein
MMRWEEEDVPDDLEEVNGVVHINEANGPIYITEKKKAVHINAVNGPIHISGGIGLTRIDRRNDSGEYGNALQAASARGHEQVVKLLLDKGADLNAQGGEYGNALQAAAARGHEQVVKLLLDKGADPNAQGGEYGNALQAASARGHEQVVKLRIPPNHYIDSGKLMLATLTASNPPARPETPPSPSCAVPFRRDHDFVGRRTLLDQIREKSSTPASRVALVGLGGMG